jgi:pimeloyl-ACP methyl ester carboxylesterase
MILHHAVEGSGPRVLLLHPVGLDLTFLQPLAQLLAARHQVMLMDLRGHGRSPLLPLAPGLEAFADDVHETLAAKRFAPCAVVGFSFGGMIAQVLALRHAGDLAALVPCACPGTLTDEGRRVARQRGEDAERGGMQSVLEATLDRWFTAPFRASGGDAAARERLLGDEPRGWAQGWRAIAGIDAIPRLGSVRVPTLCVAGELDKSSPPHVVKAIADAIPGAQFKVLPGAPHMLFIEQPEAVARALLDFL